MAGSMMIAPKPAQAFLGFGDLTIKIGDVYQVLKDIGLGALRQVALEVSNKFLTKLTAKLQDKYKIRNYLYYDQVLTAYYLNNYISDKIDDPDLRQIYGMLSAGFISGTPTGASTPTGPGATKQPNLNRALIPRLNKAISKYYLERQGGINPNKIYNPAAGVTDREYFATAQAYFSNPPSFTEQNLRAQFGAFQSAATTAAQLEVIVGNGLKAGRIVGGTCSLPSAPVSAAPNESWLAKIGLVNVAHAQETDDSSDTASPPLLDSSPAPVTTPSVPPAAAAEHSATQTNTPATCEAVGGKWQPSALDKARAFIDNPTTAVAGWLDGAIKAKLNSNFDPNSFWAIIGSLAGSFIFKELTLDRDQNSDKGVLNEDPSYVYGPTTAADNAATGKGMDIDGDNIEDGFDIDGDGALDICTYGGIDSGRTATPGPPCKGSSSALTAPPPCTLELSVNSQVNNQVNNSVTTDPTTGQTTNSANGTATGNATGSVTANCPDEPPAEGGACSQFLTEGANQMTAAVSDAMRAMLADFGSVPADEGSISAYRDAVVSYLNSHGFVAARGFNGNCNSSSNNLGVQVNAANGEMYDIVRKGAMCTQNGSGSGTIAQHVDPCRLPPIGYTGTWNFISTGAH